MTQEALKLALEALEKNTKHLPVHFDNHFEAITAIKEALAQPEQEPVGKFAKFTDNIWREVTDGSAGVPLYTTPPQRTWVGLTDDEVVHLKMLGRDLEFVSMTALRRFVRDIEAKLKERNT